MPNQLHPKAEISRNSKAFTPWGDEADPHFKGLCLKDCEFCGN